jgi:hypothetical protein
VLVSFSWRNSYASCARLPACCRIENLACIGPNRDFVSDAGLLLRVANNTQWIAFGMGNAMTRENKRHLPETLAG